MLPDFFEFYKNISVYLLLLTTNLVIYGEKSNRVTATFSGGNQMKKHFRIIAALLASVMLMGLMLSGCGKAEPTVEDAKKYVDSTLLAQNNNEDK